MRRGAFSLRSALVAVAVSLLPMVAPPRGVAQPAPCRIERQAELSLLGRSPILVAAEIDGSAVSMIVDTGAQWTTITPQTVERLHLPADPWNGGLHRGVGSFSSGVNAIVHRFRLGGMTLENRSLSVAPLAYHPTGAALLPPFAGLLGADFLFRFDLDLELPHGRLALYRNPGCEAGVPPWDIPVTAIPLVKSATNRLNLAVGIDGHPFRAIIDTGATGLLITRPNALRAGVAPAVLERDPQVAGHALGTAPVMMRQHVFEEVQIGAERFKRLELVIGGTQLGGGDMLLGLDYLGSRRVWLSYALRRMFVAGPGER